MKLFYHIILFFLINCGSIHAQLSPGDLHQSHADLEGIKNCTVCHGHGQKILAENCLKCHSLLRERITKNLGLHASPAYQHCEKCHVEHHGRDFDLIWWPDGQENFDHSPTGFLLQGKHLALKCRDCHQEKFLPDRDQLTQSKIDPNRTFLGLQKNCVNCHPDEHQSQLGTGCQACHQFDKFIPAPLFNHTRSRFPLTGKHNQVSCEKCHPLVTRSFPAEDTQFRKYKDLRFRGCQDCHQDIHQNRFGSNCSSCHNTSGWKNYNQQEFDHHRTRYPLVGKHRQLNCEKCHTPGKPLRPIAFDRCRDCHVDYHQGQFTHRLQKGACEECHIVQGFIPAQFTIEQHNQTTFSLAGGHLAVPCNACHKKYPPGTGSENIRFKFSETSCASCHPDPHAGTVNAIMKNKGCEFCHSVQGWRDVRFDHGTTAFPLTYKHALLACRECHPVQEPGKVKITKLSFFCQDCHKDSHSGQFADIGLTTTRCERCHIPKNWKDTIFDHNTMADFKLEGAHRDTDCKKCHTQILMNGVILTRYKPIAHDCTDCHGKKPNPENQSP